MSVARVGLHIPPAWLPDKPRMLRASRSESRPELPNSSRGLGKEIDCEHEMELLGFPKIPTAEASTSAMQYGSR